MTGADLFEMYQTNYPMLTADDFERIVAEYKCFYCCEEEYESFDITPNNGKENNPKEKKYDF